MDKRVRGEIKSFKAVRERCLKMYVKRHGASFAVIFLAFIMTAGVNAGEYVTASVNMKAAAEPSVSAKSAIVINADNGEVLYEKNSDVKSYPASTTKIMTALLAVETLENLQSPIEQWVSVPKEAVGIEGSSIYLEAGEEIRFKDLLYGMMLRSGNDAATAIAIIIGGSVENFVEMMNERASALGCTDTNFVNPSGLFDENHYTTARDLAVISMEAMKNATFSEIAAAKEYTAERGNEKYNYFCNKNKTVYQYNGGNGIKIGYTKASGRALAASAERSGTKLICIVMDADDWFNDAYKLMDYCFTYGT